MNDSLIRESALIASVSAEAAYHEVCAYTLSLGDSEFIHQHVVDAYAVQTANSASKAISVVFALIGLYLATVHGYTGREVQRVHMQLARKRKQWPAIPLPENRGRNTAEQVLLAGPGAERNAAIVQWRDDVWRACRSLRGQIESLLEECRVWPTSAHST